MFPRDSLAVLSKWVQNEVSNRGKTPSTSRPSDRISNQDKYATLGRAAHRPGSKVVVGTKPYDQRHMQTLTGCFFCLMLMLCVLVNPLIWKGDLVSVWAPHAGLALVVLAWFGFQRGPIILLLAGVTVFLQYFVSALFGTPFWVSPGQLNLSSLIVYCWLALDLLLGVGEAYLGWWIYSAKAKGNSRLSDPRSAMQFILIVPLGIGLSIAIVRLALLHLLFAGQIDLAFIDASVGKQLAMFWLERSLGMVVVAPLLLIVGTPVLRRWKILPQVRMGETCSVPNGSSTPSPNANPGSIKTLDSQSPSVFSTSCTDNPPENHFKPDAKVHAGLDNKSVASKGTTAEAFAHDRATEGSSGSKGNSWFGNTDIGDWIEILGLTICTSLLGWLMSSSSGIAQNSPNPFLGLQLWGILVLLIVWASMRQGLKGGTIVASCAAIVPLVAMQQSQSAGDVPVFNLFLQAHLFAQCSAGLLISAGMSWIRLRETGYRQVVSHVAVVIYSARLLQLNQTRAPRSARGTNPRELDQNSIVSGIAEVNLVSAASARLLGCSADQLLGDFSRWLSFVHPDDREIVLAALDQLSLQDQPVICEYRLATPLPSSNVNMANTPLPEKISKLANEGRAYGREGSGSGRHEGTQSFRWLRDTLAPHRDLEGRLIGWEGVVTDITEQRYLADDLRRMTSMFHTLIGNLPTGVFFIQGPQGQPILVNARARQLLGQREDTSAGLEHLSKVYRLFRADGSLYPAEELPVYLALKQGRTAMRDDIVVHRPDGRKVPLVTWAAPIHLGGREISDAAVWVLEDLTALHQAEAARKDTETRLRAIIETMAEGLIVVDHQGNILTGNPAASTLFGLSLERTRQINLFNLEWDLIRDDGSSFGKEEHPVWLVLKSGRPVRNLVVGFRSHSMRPTETDSLNPLNCHVRDQGGAPVRWLLVNAMPLNSSVPAKTESIGSRNHGVVITFTDISGYRQARESIRHSEERHRELLESLPLMLIQTDLQMKVVYANSMMSQVTGYSPEEVADPAIWTSHIHFDDLPNVIQMHQMAMQGKNVRGEIRFRAKNGTEKVAILINQPVIRDEETVGVLSLLLDVTRERQLERDLNRVQRLQLVGRLSSGVAHDFNNLIGVVMNLCELAQLNLPSTHPVFQDLERINQVCEQASGLASQLLALGKQRPVSPKRIDLNNCVTKTLELLRPSIPGTIQVQLSLHSQPKDEHSLICDFGSELYLHADETQIQQVIMNLCLNARDAMPNGGVLRLQTGVRQESHSGMSSSQIVLRISDSGKGMDEIILQRIFEPFFTTKDAGTGLGLAIVQQIVDSYGGSIQVTSKPGEGATFEVTWPMVQA